MRWLILFSLSCVSAHAGYRVHKLALTHYDNQGRPVRQEEVLSTLDHLQYEHYYSGYRNLRAVLIDTWYCPGDTSRKAFCPNPAETQPKRGIASTNPKRGELPIGRQPVIP